MSVSNPPSAATTTWHKPAMTGAPSAPAEAAGLRPGLEGGAAITRSQRLAWALAWAVIAGGFVLIGGGNLDLGVEASRLGMAASEGLGPFGRVYGGWQPDLWPLHVWTAQAWAWGEGGTATAAAVRWPQAIAGLVAGLVLTLRLSRGCSPRAGWLTALCWFGSLGLMHHTRESGLDLIAGMTVIGALEAILNQRRVGVQSAWLALAALAGGWPPILLVGLPLVVLGSTVARMRWQALIAPVAVFTAWSAWALSTAPAEAWASALILPLYQPTTWGLPLHVLLAGLPWTPIAALAAFPSIRSAWSPSQAQQVRRWLQVSGIALVASWLIPGLSRPGLVLALAGLAVAGGNVLDAVWSGAGGKAARRCLLGTVVIMALALGAIATVGGGYLAAAVSYYRQIAILLIILAGLTLLAAAAAAAKGRPRWALGVILGLAVCVKIAHWGIYVPEWNYRLGKGPWGRAVGQWVLPNQPIHIFHTWPADLMFHTQRPVRQLPNPLSLQFLLRDNQPRYVLLQASELEHWPDRAPALVVVRRFEDERGLGQRVLARTEGDLGITPRTASAQGPKPMARVETERAR